MGEVSRVYTNAATASMYIQNNICSCQPNYYLSSSGICQSSCSACLSSDPNHICTTIPTFNCSCQSPYIPTASSNYQQCDCPPNTYGPSCTSCSSCIASGSNKVCIQGLHGSCSCASGFILSNNTQCVVSCLINTHSIYNNIIGLFHFDGGVIDSFNLLSSQLIGSNTFSYSGLLGLSLSTTSSYVQVNNIPSLNDFTYALFFKGLVYIIIK